MFEHFNTLRTLLQQAEPVMINYLDSARVETMKRDIDTRSTDHQPIVMVYGVYNAGKSTLINALLGEKRAEVGDVPKTDRVDAYQMGDVTILDTPGIDAPIEHEQITREQLSKSDAVIFVLCSDGVLEELSTYQEIEKILRADKPMLVVINNKNGYKPTDSAYITLQEKFRSNLYSYFSDDQSMLAKLDSVPTHLINAQAALKGKLENKPALVELSRLPALTRAVQRLFEQTNSTQVAKTLSVQLQNLLLQAIEQARAGSKDGELKQLQELIENAQQSQLMISQKILNHAERARAGLKNQLVQMLQEGNSAIEPLLEDWKADQGNYFESQMTREMQRLDTQAADVSRLLLHVSGSVQLGTEQAEEGEGQGFSDLAGSLVKKGLKLGYNEQAVAKGMVEVMKQGKQWFPELFKGIGPKTMGKMAGKAAPFIGPTIDVIMAGWDYYKAREVEERQILQQRQHMEAIRLSVSSLVDDLYATLSESVEDSVHDCYYPLINSLQHSLQTLAGEAASLNSDVACLQNTQQQLQQVFHSV